MTKRTLVRRARTSDRESQAPPVQSFTQDRQTIHTVAQIGPKRMKLANGFLLCQDVPVARTGWMMYRAGETPIKTRDNHPVAYVQRGPEELFSPQAIGSLISAVVTDDHPVVDVTPKNAGHLGRGYCIDARRGDGEDADVLLADLIITDERMIEQIDSGKREISLGYSADYFQTQPGEGRQANIIVNHIALVERGRCGPRCAIGDSAGSDPFHQLSHEDSMPQPKTPAARERVKLARTKVADAIAELDAVEADGEEQDGVHVHVHTGTEPGERASTLDAATEERFVGLESNIENLADSMLELTEAVKALTGTPPAARTTDGAPGEEGDSKALERGFQELASQAEILVPGFRMPTFDAAAQRAKTVDAMCGARRQVLTTLAATAPGKELVTSIAGEDLDLEKADCSHVAIVFRSAAALKGSSNNTHATRDSGRTPVVIPGALTASAGGAPRPSMTVAEMNAAADKFWGRTPATA
jgi:hypothetical protein